ncbi:MAG: ribosome maturation factor RimM [Erythrobacter sp.]
MADQTVPSKPLELAAITGAHGVTGEVRLKLFGEGVEALSRIKTFDVGGAIGTLTLKKVRSDKKTGAVARFAEVTDRNAAEKLRGTLLTAPRDTLPQLDAGEYYHVDLVGLSVLTNAGEAIGTVTEVVNYGATDILEILREPPPEKGMKSFMVPITKDAVIEWDTEKLVIAAAFAEG